MKQLLPMGYSPIEKIQEDLFDEHKLHVSVLREDKNHPLIQGNKLRKLTYNLLNSKKKGNKTLLTFGGAYSNHIAAVAAAGKEFGFHTIGIVRGEEKLPLNPTLSLCTQNGMELHYEDRTTYKLKNTQDYKEHLRNKFGSFYLIPEGGTNYYAINGCMEIIERYDEYDYICCPIGTGGTVAGITISNQGKSKILGFSSLKGGEFLTQEIRSQIHSVVNDEELTDEVLHSFELVTDFHFGGYAKITEDLLNFVRKFYSSHQIKWDLLYNGKMAYGVYEMIKQGFFPEHSRILLVHTGGIQGIAGIEERNNIRIYED